MVITCRSKDKTLKPKLVKLSKAEKRTLSNYIELILQKHVKGSPPTSSPTLHP
jgi:hypothetical protein